MPDVPEVFEMATSTVRPDPGVEERQHRKQRTHAARQRAGAYAVVAAVLIAATVFGVVTLGGGQRTRPAAEGQLTRETLAGVWRTRGVDADSASLLTFVTDGGFMLQSASPMPPRLRGTYEIEGDTITLTDPHLCTGMQWTAGLPEAGVLEFSLTDKGLRIGELATPDSCTGSLGSGVEESDTFAFERISPRSRATADLDSAGRAEDGAPPSLFGDLSGVWLMDDGDLVLQIDLFADDVANYSIWEGGALAPRDAGSVRIEGIGRYSDTPGVDDGSLIFSSNTLNPTHGSPTCPEGTTVMVWENILVAGDAFVADVPSEACGGLAPGRVSWLRVSGAGDYR